MKHKQTTFMFTNYIYKLDLASKNTRDDITTPAKYQTKSNQTQMFI